MPFTLNSKQELNTAINLPSVDEILLQQRQKIERPTFSPWKVETLLNQALDLLDRNQREMSKYNELRARWIELCTSVYAEGQELAILEGMKDRNVHTLSKRIDETTRDGMVKYLDKTTSEGWDEIWRCLGVAWSVSVNKGDQVGEHNYASQQRTSKKEYIKSEAEKAAFDLKVQQSEEESNKFANTLVYLKDVHDAKIQAMNAAGGALNFSEQSNALLEQMQIDYDDAVLRLEAANVGLKNFFGYGHGNGEEDLAKPYSLDGLVSWARKSVAWMIAFNHKDQSATSIISIRERAGEKWGKLVEAIKNGNEYEMMFQWDGGALKGASCVRVTGISAAYIGDYPLHLFKLRIQLPIHAISRQHGQEVTLEQELPACVIGEVRHINASQEPETVGGFSLRNASPLGNNTAAGFWQVNLSNALPGPNPNLNLQDIIIRVKVNVNGDL